MLARRGVSLAIGGTGWCLVGSRSLPMPNIYVTKDNRAGSHFIFIPVINFMHITFSEVLLKVWALKHNGYWAIFSTTSRRRRIKDLRREP